jgi:hypothetical protein
VGRNFARGCYSWLDRGWGSLGHLKVGRGWRLDKGQSRASRATTQGWSDLASLNLDEPCCDGPSEGHELLCQGSWVTEKVARHSYPRSEVLLGDGPMRGGRRQTPTESGRTGPGRGRGRGRGRNEGEGEDETRARTGRGRARLHVCWAPTSKLSGPVVAGADTCADAASRTLAAEVAVLPVSPVIEPAGEVGRLPDLGGRPATRGSRERISRQRVLLS